MVHIPGPSSEDFNNMTSLKLLCAIMHITICLPTCCLSGNFHILADYNWYVRSMERIVNYLETAIEAIDEERDLILKEEFIMLIFQGIMDELTPFEKSGPTCSKISL